MRKAPRKRTRRTKSRSPQAPALAHLPLDPRERARRTRKTTRRDTVTSSELETTLACARRSFFLFLCVAADSRLKQNMAKIDHAFFWLSRHELLYLRYSAPHHIHLPTFLYILLPLFIPLSPLYRSRTTFHPFPSRLQKPVNTTTSIDALLQCATKKKIYIYIYI